MTDSLRSNLLEVCDHNLFFLNGRKGALDGFQVGLQPDIACKPDSIETSYWQSGSQEAGSLKDDPCVQMAISSLNIHA